MNPNSERPSSHLGSPRQSGIDSSRQCCLERQTSRSLLLGYYKGGELVFAGKAGTGFSPSGGRDLTDLPLIERKQALAAPIGRLVSALASVLDSPSIRSQNLSCGIGQPRAPGRAVRSAALGPSLGRRGGRGAPRPRAPLLLREKKVRLKPSCPANKLERPDPRLASVPWQYLRGARWAELAWGRR